MSPATPVETHLAAPNRVLIGGSCAALPPIALAALSCAAIWLCDLSPPAARALTSHAEGVGPFSRRLAGPSWETPLTAVACLTRGTNFTY